MAGRASQPVSERELDPRIPGHVSGTHGEVVAALGLTEIVLCHGLRLGYVRNAVCSHGGGAGGSPPGMRV